MIDCLATIYVLGFKVIKLRVYYIFVCEAPIKNIQKEDWIGDWGQGRLGGTRNWD